MFDIRISKWSENTQKKIIWSKEKNKNNYFFLKVFLKSKKTNMITIADAEDVLKGDDEEHTESRLFPSTIHV
jgi:hypothetical protein